MVEIRPATLDDDAALLAIDQATWTPLVSPAPRPDLRTTFFSERVTPADVLVADEDGTVVGWAALRNTMKVPAHAHVLEINGLAVDPTATGRGIGRALVEGAFAEALRRGARKTTLRVLGSNTGARRLYLRCGFVEEGVLRAEFLLDGAFVDDVLMARYAANASPPRQSTMGSAQSGQGTS